MSDPAPEQRLVVEEAGGEGIPVLVLEGELDPHTAPTLQAALDRVLTEPGNGLELDLTRLSFIDSSGLRVLIDAHSTVSSEGAELVIRNPSSTARRLLEITRLDDHFRIVES